MKTLKGIVRALAMVALLASCGKDPKVDEHPGGGDPQIQGDVLPGEFSISQTKKVRFAKGNLKVSKVEGQYSKWEFHEHQYDFIGINNVTKPQKKANITMKAMTLQKLSIYSVGQRRTIPMQSGEFPALWEISISAVLRIRKHSKIGVRT